MIYYCNCDGNGTDSIQDILDAHPTEITYVEGGNFEKYDLQLIEVYDKIQKGDSLIIDTISALAATLRREHRFRNLGPKESMWKMQDDWDKKNSLSVYDMAEKMIMQRLKMFRNKEVSITVLCHEDKQINERTLATAIGPEMTPAFYKRLNEACSDMFRLSIEFEQTQDKNGEVVVNEKRILTLRPTEEVITKFHLSFEKSKTIPPKMTNPTVPKLHKRLGKVPSFLCVYGPPGAGKTTFSLSQFLDMEKTK